MSHKCVIEISEGWAEGRSGSLVGTSRAEVQAILGFAPVCEGEPGKVPSIWKFTVDGVFCAVWDYKGSSARGEFSTFGPDEALKAVFGDKVAGVVPANRAQ